MAWLEPKCCGIIAPRTYDDKKGENWHLTKKDFPDVDYQERIRKT